MLSLLLLLSNGLLEWGSIISKEKRPLKLDKNNVHALFPLVGHLIVLLRFENLDQQIETVNEHTNNYPKPNQDMICLQSACSM